VTELVYDGSKNRRAGCARRIENAFFGCGGHGPPYLATQPNYRLPRGLSLDRSESLLALARLLSRGCAGLPKGTP